MLSQIKPQAPVGIYESALIAGLYLKRPDLPLLFSLWTAPVTISSGRERLRITHCTISRVVTVWAFQRRVVPVSIRGSPQFRNVAISD